MSLINPKERMWQPYPALRQILEEKLIPDRYYGASSVSDNSFDATLRLMQITILIQENRTEIEKQRDNLSLRNDLYQVCQACENVARQFREQGAQIAELVG
jgi:hypothetical protein